MRAVFTALLLASSASADFILQQTWADDACQTSVSLSIYLSPAGPVDQNGCTKSAAGGGSGSPTSYRIVCTPSGPGLYNVSSYLGAGCNGAPTSISPQDRGGCNGRGISQSCVVGTVFPAGPTSGAVVTKGGYGSEVKSCPVPSSAVESQIRISASQPPQAPRDASCLAPLTSTHPPPPPSLDRSSDGHLPDICAQHCAARRPRFRSRILQHGGGGVLYSDVLPPDRLRWTWRRYKQCDGVRGRYQDVGQLPIQLHLHDR